VYLMVQLGAGDDAPPEHPMIAAIRNSSDPTWKGSYYDAGDPSEWIKPVENLTEP
jgi:hypothetical protein